MSLNQQSNILSIDIGGSKLIVGVVDYSGKVICKKKILLPPNINERELTDLIITLTHNIRNIYPDINIKGAGVTIPGLADFKNGIWIYACFSGIKNFKIGETLSKQLNLPVYIENDVNACAYAEKIYGSCKNTNNYIWVTISNGIGGGLILQGEIYHGAFGNAGEIGHVNVEKDGNLCSCGNRGCLEAYASGRAIARSYIYRNPECRKNGEGRPSAKDIAGFAREGDETAKEVYKEVGFYLGKAISFAVNMINPQKVVLGGGVAMDMDLFLPNLLSTVEEMSFKAANRDLKIEKTMLLYDAALLGAAAIAQKGMGDLK